MEVVKNKGEVTIFKEKSKKKKWNPFKKSHKVIEKRREQQIVEYGDEEPTKLSEEEKPVCPEDEEPTKLSEEENSTCPGDDNITYEEVGPLTILEAENRSSQIILECSGDGKTPMDSKVDEDCEPSRVSEDLRRTKNHLKVVSLRMKSFFLSFVLAVIIFVGVKVVFPEVDLQMIGGISMIGFFVALLIQELFSSNNSCQCHVLSGEECTCHTLFGIYFGILI